MKHCGGCNTVKPYSDFGNHAGRPDGKQTQCKECINAFARQRWIDKKDELYTNQKKYRKKHFDIFREWKKTLQCTKCPENHPSCIEFHHTDPTIDNYRGISSIAWSGATLKRVIESIEEQKCIVICSNCHLKLHWKEVNCE